MNVKLRKRRGWLYHVLKYWILFANVRSRLLKVHILEIDLFSEQTLGPSQRPCHWSTIMWMNEINQEISPRICSTQEAAISVTNGFHVNRSRSPLKPSVSDYDWPYIGNKIPFFYSRSSPLSLSLSLSVSHCSA